MRLVVLAFAVSVIQCDEAYASEYNTHEHRARTEAGTHGFVRAAPCFYTSRDEAATAVSQVKAVKQRRTLAATSLLAPGHNGLSDS